MLFSGDARSNNPLPYLRKVAYHNGKHRDDLWYIMSPESAARRDLDSNNDTGCDFGTL